MPKRTEVRLLDEIREGLEGLRHSLFLTYTFDPEFFENSILRTLTPEEAPSIVVVMDGSVYSGLFDVGVQRPIHIGKYYYVEPVLLPRLFHAKACLLVAEDSAKLWLGSFNLTETSFKRTAEISASFSGDRRIGMHPVILDFASFLRRLVEDGIIKSRRNGEVIIEIVEDIGKIQEAEPEGSISFLHTLDSNLMSQLPFDPRDKIDTIILVSPFHDDDLGVVKKLSQKNPSNIKILLQEKSKFPKDYFLREFDSQSQSVEFLFPQFKDNEDRYIHAKLLVAKCERSSLCYIGSGNATWSGMMSSVPGGNVEIGIVRKEPNPEYFDYLFDTESFNVTGLNLSELVLKPPIFRPQGPAGDFHLIDANLRENSRIEVWYDKELPPDSWNVQLFCGEATKEDGTEILPDNVECDHLEAYLPPGVPLDSRKALWVQVQAKSLDDDITLRSTKRWVSLRHLELLRKIRSREEVILESHGRRGLIALLEETGPGGIAADPNTLAYILEILDFEDLYSVLRRVRNAILPPLKDAEEFSEEASDPELPTFDIKGITDRLMRRHRSRFSRLGDEMEVILEEDSFEDYFNLFLFLSKMNIWLFLRSREKPIEILANCKSLLTEYVDSCDRPGKGFLTEASRVLGKQRHAHLVKRLSIQCHTAIIMCLVLQLQRSQPRPWRERNKYVIPVFEKSFGHVVGKFFWLFESSNHQEVFPVSQFKAALEEYNEFESLKIDEASMRKCLRGIQ